jgi:hypothetical protein
VVGVHANTGHRAILEGAGNTGEIDALALVRREVRCVDFRPSPTNEGRKTTTLLSQEVERVPCVHPDGDRGPHNNLDESWRALEQATVILGRSQSIAVNSTSGHYLEPLT